MFDNFSDDPGDLPSFSESPGEVTSSESRECDFPFEITELVITQWNEGLFQLWLVFGDGTTCEFGSLSPIEVLDWQGANAPEDLIGQRLVALQLNDFTSHGTELVLHATGNVTCRFGSACGLDSKYTLSADGLDLPRCLSMGGVEVFHAGTSADRSRLTLAELDLLMHDDQGAGHDQVWVGAWRNPSPGQGPSSEP